MWDRAYIERIFFAFRDFVDVAYEDNKGIWYNLALSRILEENVGNNGIRANTPLIQLEKIVTLTFIFVIWLIN